MLRHHTISYPREWIESQINDDGNVAPGYWRESYQEDVLYTAEEQTARDTEELINAAAMRKNEQTLARLTVLKANLADDTITLPELREWLRLVHKI